MILPVNRRFWKIILQMLVVISGQLIEKCKKLSGIPNLIIEKKEYWNIFKILMLCKNLLRVSYYWTIHFSTCLLIATANKLNSSTMELPRSKQNLKLCVKELLKCLSISRSPHRKHKNWHCGDYSWNPEDDCPFGWSSYKFYIYKSLKESFLSDKYQFLW